MTELRSDVLCLLLVTSTFTQSVTLDGIFCCNVNDLFHLNLSGSKSPFVKALSYVLQSVPKQVLLAELQLVRILHNTSVVLVFVVVYCQFFV